MAPGTRHSSSPRGSATQTSSRWRTSSCLRACSRRRGSRRSRATRSPWRTTPTQRPDGASPRPTSGTSLCCLRRSSWGGPTPTSTLGYRTLLALALASEYYDDPDLRSWVVSRKQVYPETQLLAQFETGGLDAAFVYRNMAVERDYPYVELPPELNLGAPSMADRYATATVTLDDGTTFTGGPIAYGATLRTDRPAAQSVFETLVASTDDYLTDHGFVLRDAHPTYHGMFQTESIPETDRQTGWFVVGASLGVLLLLYYLVPLGALLFAQSPASVAAQLGSARVVSAARNSLLTATASTALSAALGLPLAYWLARTDVRGKNAVLTLVLLPLVLPPIVSGMLLLEVVGPNGLGAFTSLSFTRSLFGVVLAQTFVASPFFVVTTKAAFESVDRHFEHASRSLGKSRKTTFRRITLPLAIPGIVAGLTLTFARAIGEFGATLMMAYYPRTLPVQIWRSFLNDGLAAAFPSPPSCSSASR